MPLAFLNIGDEMIVERIGGDKETIRHLKELGITVGDTVKVTNSVNGDLVIEVKGGTKIALNKDQCMKIFVR